MSPGFVRVRVGGTIRQVRAIETPAETGFRDLLGHWVFEDDLGDRIDTSDIAEPDRITIIKAAHAKTAREG